MEKLRISELLKERNLTFTELAAGIGVKRTTLNYILSSDKIRLNTLMKIAKFLHVEVSELMVEEEVDIKGFVKLKMVKYDLSDMNDFSKFFDCLAVECGIHTDLYFEPKKN